MPALNPTAGPMPTAYLRYSLRNVTQRSGGRFEYSDIWQVPGIISYNSPDGDGTGPINRPGTNTWLHEALGAQNLPQIGDVSQDGGMVVAALIPRSMPDQGTAEIEVKWQEDPLTLPTEVHYFSSGKVKPAWHGLNSDCSTGPPTAPRGNALHDFTDIRNTAGDRFNPPVVYEVPLERIEILKHCSLKWHDKWDWSQYVKRWNNAQYAVVTADPDNAANTSSRNFATLGTLFLADKRAVEVKEPYLHRILTLTFIYDPDTFGVRVANMGPRCRKHLALDGGGNLTLAAQPSNTDNKATGPVTDCLGRPFGGIAELDANGDQLLPTSAGPPVVFPQAMVKAWYPTDDNGNPYSCDFNDLALFTPERTLVI